MKNRTMRIIMCGIFLFTLTACSTNTPTWQEQYDLGVRYLEEGSYEEAIIAFAVAIEIDPKLAEAYLGAAEAHIALGNHQAAVAILQKGLDATDDEAIHFLIDELSAAKNLTGQEIFTPSDLDNWDYPYGLDIYEMAQKGICDQEDIDEFLHDREDPARMDNFYHTSNIVKWHPEVSVHLYNGLINSVDIGSNDMDMGPRGICVGMSLHDVLNQFYCENENAIAYATSLDPNLIPESGSGSYTTFDLYDKYSETDEWYYSAYMGFSDESTVKLMYECQPFYGSSVAHCNLQITFKDGVAVRIWISYAYDDFDSGTD